MQTHAVCTVNGRRKRLSQLSLNVVKHFYFISQLHFAGPHAAQLEQDFGRLMRTGRQDGPSINIPGYIPDPNRKTKFGYKECDSEAVNASPNTDIKRTYSSLSGGSLSLSTHNKSHGIFLFSTFLLMLLMHHQRL